MAWAAAARGEEKWDAEAAGPSLPEVDWDTERRDSFRRCFLEPSSSDDDSKAKREALHIRIDDSAGHEVPAPVDSFESLGVLPDYALKALQENGMRFKQFSVSALLVSVDYRAKRLDVGALRRGELWELVNILPLLEGLEVAFRSVTVSGVVGLNQVLAHLVNAWSTDLNRTQILRSLTGVTPIRSFANIGSGFADMVLEPLKQYRAGKDSHQVSSALLRGLVSFLKHVTVESMDLTERILVGTQSALEYVNSCLREPADGQVAGVAGAGQVVIRRELLEGSDGSLAALSQHWTPVERGATDFLQPGSAAEGLQQACTNLSRGMRHAGQAVVGRPLLELQRGASREKVLKSIVSGIPVCVLRPAIEATAAATTALRGVRNSVDPVRRREVVKKYKEPE
mmetsp:Transcript_80364/g.146950  ORF Transcript_80364/g.146950 Transcript_80364/m.146950 type:complete len:398 (-) Transcript_80364:62-1255(-)